MTLTSYSTFDIIYVFGLLYDITVTMTHLSSIEQIDAMKTTGSDWVLANLDVVGYYRVNYDDANWDRLLSALSINHEVSHNYFW